MANVRALVPGGQSGSGEPDATPEEAAILGQMGEYQLLAKLGEGGMGAVYKARQTNLDRIVALKVLRTSRMEDERAVPRFYREMRAVGRLTHPNIVQAYDAREIDGTPILAMEYVEGVDLSELVRRAGKLKVADACELIRQAAVGLQCAHEGGLVHRDIKPSNLMVTPDGTVKILDLGLALLDSGQPNGGEMTGSGQAMGTADYMAPEQAFDSHQVDIRADIYALGCTLYKLLAGRTPFSGPQYTSNMAKLMAHVQEPIPPITEHRQDIPAELVAILDRMLAKSADDRFAAPGEVAAVLEPLAADNQVPGLLASLYPENRALAADSSLANTDPFHSSALVGTVSVHGPSIAPHPGRAKRPPWRRIAIAAGLFSFLFVLGVVIWINRTRIEVPEGSEVAVKPDGSVSVQVPEEDTSGTMPARNKTSFNLPISGWALVSRPASLPGVRSWTIETKGPPGCGERCRVQSGWEVGRIRRRRRYGAALSRRFR